MSEITLVEFLQGPCAWILEGFDVVFLLVRLLCLSRL